MKFITLNIEDFKGNDEINVQKIDYHSGMNRPFKLEVNCKYNGKERIRANEVVGRKINIKISDKQNVRYFNGIIYNLCQSNFFSSGDVPSTLEFTLYIGPELTLMNEVEFSKVFSGGKVVDYIKEVTGKYGIDVKTPGRPDFIDREHCIQYRETDLCFINRLMESEGIFYYFKHNRNETQMILGSNITDYDSENKVQFGDKSNEVYYDSFTKENPLLIGCSSLNDFDFYAPMKNLKLENSKSKGKAVYVNSEVSSYRYLYSVRSYKNYNDNTVDVGEKYSSLHLDSKQTNNERIHLRATGVWWGLDTGAIFSVKGEENDFLITGYNLSIVDGENVNDKSISIKLTAIDADQIYRPLINTSMPDIPVQTATVVGIADGTVFNKTDKGSDRQILVKVKFHWDIEHSKDSSECSCWIRSGQVYAGNQRGFIFTPRVGDEVIVAFESGHPDVPLITGGVHNGKNKIPYSLNENRNVTGIVSTTIGDENSRSSAILFKDDKDQEEFSLLTKGKQINVVGKDSLRQVDGSVTEHIKSNINQTVDGDVQQKIGGKLLVEASQIAFKVGGNFIQLAPEGITMMGAQVLENSGGEAPEVQPELLPDQQTVV